MFNRIVGWLVGEATEGQRKMIYGTLALLLAFVVTMWAPGKGVETAESLEALRADGLGTMWKIVAAIVLGNGIEWGAKAIQGWRQSRQDGAAK